MYVIVFPYAVLIWVICETVIYTIKRHTWVFRKTNTFDMEIVAFVWFSSSVTDSFRLSRYFMSILELNSLIENARVINHDHLTHLLSTNESLYLSLWMEISVYGGCGIERALSSCWTIPYETGRTAA